MLFFTVIIILVFSALFVSLYMLRKEGYSDIWEQLMNHYAVKEFPEEYPACKEPMYVYRDQHWIEWSEAWLIFSPEGIYFKQPVFIEWLAPGLLIPWQAIIETKYVDVLAGQRLALNIKHIGYSVAIDCRHKEVIDNGGIGFSA